MNVDGNPHDNDTPSAPVPARRETGRATTLPPTLESRLFAGGFNFDFFQAVRILQRLDPKRRPVGRGGPPHAEAVRFRARVSLSFPPSSIYEIRRPTTELPVAVMVQSFLGLTGPSGVLPRHYTELLYRLEREKGPDRHALRDWLDLFNHRFVSLFYRAWEKYRFYLPYERGAYNRDEPDTFTTALFSLVGHGLPPLRKRLIVAWRGQADGGERTPEWPSSSARDRERDRARGGERGQGRILARIEDLTLLHFGGLLAHRPRNASGLEGILGDYFRQSVSVHQFQGQWLPLESSSQTRLGEEGGVENNQLGFTAVAGEKVWDVQTKFRVRVGPLGYGHFLDFLPDFAPVVARKGFFLLVHLVRLYVGLELDFDVQLVLNGEDVPECQLADDGNVGARLGWNTWVRSLPFEGDADDAVFEGVEVFGLDDGQLLEA